MSSRRGRSLEWPAELTGYLGGLADRAALDACSRGGLEAAVEDLGIEMTSPGHSTVRVSGIDADLLENLTALADRGEPGSCLAPR